MINSQQKVSGANSIDSPAATTNGDNYVLAWTTGDQSISWTTCPAANSQNSYAWVQVASIPNAASSGGPALVNFAGKVRMVWKGEGTDTRIFISSLSGSTWSASTPIPGIGTSSAPAITATASELFLAWKGESDNKIYWSKSADGTTWSPEAAVPGAGSTDTPALAAFNGAVYLVWKGESDTKILLSEFSDAKGWGTASTVGNFGTSSGPALGFGNTGNLHLVWKGESDNFVWEATLAHGKTDWSAQAKIVTIETSARPALASQTSSTTDILLAWKGGSSTELWAAPLDNLHKLYPLPPGAKLLPTDISISWTAPEGLTPPASIAGASNSIGFGSWANQAAVAMSLVLSDDGTATFSGWYQDQGTLPVVTAPAQNYSAVVVVMASNKVAFTFSHSGNNIPTGGATDTWNITQKSDAIAKNWAFLQAKSGQSMPQALVYGSATNSVDLGSFLGTIIGDVESLAGDVEDVVNVITVIASAVG